MALSCVWWFVRGVLTPRPPLPARRGGEAHAQHIIPREWAGCGYDGSSGCGGLRARRLAGGAHGEDVDDGDERADGDHQVPAVARPQGDQQEDEDGVQRHHRLEQVARHGRVRLPEYVCGQWDTAAGLAMGKASVSALAEVEVQLAYRLP